jgi:hypothetical protein
MPALTMEALLACRPERYLERAASLRRLAAELGRVEGSLSGSAPGWRGRAQRAAEAEDRRLRECVRTAAQLAESAAGVLRWYGEEMRALQVRARQAAAAGAAAEAAAVRAAATVPAAPAASAPVQSPAPSATPSSAPSSAPSPAAAQAAAQAVAAARAQAQAAASEQQRILTEAAEVDGHTANRLGYLGAGHLTKQLGQVPGMPKIAPRPVAASQPWRQSVVRPTGWRPTPGQQPTDRPTGRIGTTWTSPGGHPHNPADWQDHHHRPEHSAGFHSPDPHPSTADWHDHHTNPTPTDKPRWQDRPHGPTTGGGGWHADPSATDKAPWQDRANTSTGTGGGWHDRHTEPSTTDKPSWQDRPHGPNTPGATGGGWHDHHADPTTTDKAPWQDRANNPTTPAGTRDGWQDRHTEPSTTDKAPWQDRANSPTTPAGTGGGWQDRHADPSTTDKAPWQDRANSPTTPAGTGGGWHDRHADAADHGNSAAWQDRRDSLQTPTGGWHDRPDSTPANAGWQDRPAPHSAVAGMGGWQDRPADPVPAGGATPAAATGGWQDGGHAGMTAPQEPAKEWTGDTGSIGSPGAIPEAGPGGSVIHSGQSTPDSAAIAAGAGGGADLGSRPDQVSTGSSTLAGGLLGLAGLAGAGAAAAAAGMLGGGAVAPAPAGAAAAPAATGPSSPGTSGMTTPGAPQSTSGPAAAARPAVTPTPTAPTTASTASTSPASTSTSAPPATTNPARGTAPASAEPAGNPSAKPATATGGRAGTAAAPSSSASSGAATPSTGPSSTASSGGTSTAPPSGSGTVSAAGDAGARGGTATPSTVDHTGPATGSGGDQAIVPAADSPTRGASGRGETPDPGSLAERYRGVNGTEAVPAGAGPAELAALWSRGEDYPGADRWQVLSLPAGALVVAPGRLLPDGREEGGAGGGFVLPADRPDDPVELFESLQVAPRWRDGRWRYPQLLSTYRLTAPLDVATSVPLANPHWGPGGGTQWFVPDFRDLVIAGHLEYVGTEPLADPVARLDADEVRAALRGDPPPTTAPEPPSPEHLQADPAHLTVPVAHLLPLLAALTSNGARIRYRTDLFGFHPARDGWRCELLDPVDTAYVAAAFDLPDTIRLDTAASRIDDARNQAAIIGLPVTEPAGSPAPSPR